MATRPYVIRQGDFLSRLAFEQGFDAQEVWNLPDNASLRAARSSGDVLCPGDVLYLPPKPPPKWLPVNVGAVNNFKGTLPTVDIHLTLTSEGAALANAACRVEGVDPPLQLTTGGDGSLSFSVPMSTNDLELVFDDPPLRYAVRPGWMDPHTEDTGIRARLVNLGYLDDATSTPDVTADAIRAFQGDSEIEPTGIADGATQQALADRHGH